ncbi:MAG: tetratricopeptide repeat protein [Terracidiphilus sp.]
MNSPLSFSWARPFGDGSGFAAASVLFWLALSNFSMAACVPPPDLRNRLQSRPGAQVHADIGEWFSERKEFDCAAQSFELASRLQPTSVSFAYLWGLSLFSAGHDTEALAPLLRASNLGPDDIRPHLSLGAALDRLKRTADAEAEWRKALLIDADSSLALDGLSQDLMEQKDYAGVIALLYKPAGGRQLSAIESLNLGTALAATVRLDDAARVLREGLNTNPGSLPIADELAIILMLQGRVNEACAVFDLALGKHPGDEITQVLYLRILVTSHSDKAPALAQELLAQYPCQWEVLYLNGVLASQDGDFPRTRDLAARSIAINPDYAQSQTLLGSALAKIGDLSGAKEHLQNAIRIGDDQPEVHYDLAKVLQSLGDQEHAADQLRIYQRLKTEQSDKVQAAGKAEEADQQMTAGDAAKAVSLYREALESDPDEPLLFYKLAKALEKTNDIAGEKSALERALALNPNLPEAQNQMGYVAARQGDSAEAEAHFRAAVHASPSYVAAWINLSATLASESKWQDAQQAVDRALEIDPDNTQARRLSEELAADRTGP